MTVEAHGEADLAVETAKPPVRRLGLRARARRLLAGVVSRYSSSLTRRIVVLNLGGLLILSAAFLYLNQFREGLIDARVQSLQTQSEIIAAAIAASAAVETDSITIDPEKLLQLAPGESYDPSVDSDSDPEFSINPERVGPVLRRLVSPTRTRARVYDRDGYPLVDSLLSTEGSTILRYPLPAPGKDESSPTLVERTWNLLRGRFGAIAPAATEVVAVPAPTFQLPDISSLPALTVDAPV